MSRTVSTSPLTLDMTVICIPELEILQPRAAPQGALPPDTVNKTVAGFATGQRLSDTLSVRVLRLASVVRTIVLVLLVFLTHVAVGYSRGLVAFVFTQPGAEGALSERFGRGQFVQCVTTFTGTRRTAYSGGRSRPVWRGSVTNDVGGLRWFGSGGSDHLCTNWTAPGVRIPIVTACVRMAIEFGLVNGLSHSDGVGTAEVRLVCGGDLSGWPTCHAGKWQSAEIGTAGLSVPFLGVRRTPIYRW